MMRRAKLWAVAAGVYFFLNLAGAIYAAVLEEEMHMMTHIFFLILGIVGYVGWRLGRRGAPRVAQAQIPAERLDYLQQSVDAIALEVERVGEAQRFAEKLRAERGDPLPLKKES